MNPFKFVLSAMRAAGVFGLYFGGDSGSTSKQTAEVPEWAKGAIQRTLGKAEALTDINKNPYQQYQGQRVAEFSPLQQQAFDRTVGMDAGPQAFGQQVGQYMSPYMQNVVDVEKREAGRASEMLGQQQQAQAAQAGAFGGYRDAIQRAERERNLTQQMGDIQTRGLQSAYDRAAGEFRSGLNQNMALNQMMAQLGGVQQGREQQLLSNQYQDFQTQQKYPYQQLEFMSNILRGTPMGTVQTMYTPGPSGAQTLASLGMGAYGLSKLFAKGGSVTDDEFVSQAISRLSDAQLQQELQKAAEGGNDSKAEIIKGEISRRVQTRGGANAGISSAFTDDMADRVLPTEESMARGGIVAFAGDDEDNEDDTGQLVGGLGALLPSPGNPATYSKLTALYPQLLSNIAGAKYTPMTDDAYNAAIQKRRTMLEEAAGEDIYKAQRDRMKEMDTGRTANLEQAKGLAALQAAAAMMEGRGFAQGLGRAGGAFAQNYGQALQADRAEKKALANMEFNLADAQRKERMGLTREAVAAADQARKDHDAAQQFKLKKASALATLTSKMASSVKPTGMGKPPAPPKLNEQLASAEIAFEKNPSEANLKAVTALRRAVDRVRTSDMGPERAGAAAAGVDVRVNEQVLAAMNKAKFSPEYLEAKTPEEKDAVLNRAADAARRQMQTQNVPARTSGGRPVNTNSSQATPNRLRFDAQGNLLP
jgi:hypothetical protein